MNKTQMKLIDTATKIIAEQGFDKANVNYIAQAAGFSVGTLYNYFPTKRALMHAVIAEISHIHVTDILDHVMQTRNPIRRIELFFEAGFNFIQSNLIKAKAIFNTLNGPDEEFKSELFKAYQPLFELVGKDIVGLGLSQGIFRDVDPGRTANIIMLLYLGTGSQFNQQGKLWVNAAEVSQFVLKSLLSSEKVE